MDRWCLCSIGLHRFWAPWLSRVALLLWSRQKLLYSSGGGPIIAAAEYACRWRALWRGQDVAAWWRVSLAGRISTRVLFTQLAGRKRRLCGLDRLGLGPNKFYGFGSPTVFGPHSCTPVYVFGLGLLALSLINFRWKKKKRSCSKITNVTYIYVSFFCRHIIIRFVLKTGVKPEVF